MSILPTTYLPPRDSAGDQFGRNRHGDGATHSNKVVSGALAAHMTSGFVPRSNIVVSEERHIWQVVSSPEPNWCSSSTPDPLIVPDQPDMLRVLMPKMANHWESVRNHKTNLSLYHISYFLSMGYLDQKTCFVGRLENRWILPIINFPSSAISHQVGVC